MNFKKPVTEAADHLHIAMVDMPPRRVTNSGISPYDSSKPDYDAVGLL